MGRDLFVLAYPTEDKILRAERTILNESTTDGHRVLEVELHGRRRLLFDCRGLSYEVSNSSDGPSYDKVMSSFLSTFLVAAGC